jgi:glycosyltransferase involved in cell wall biosynthesis
MQQWTAPPEISVVIPVYNRIDTLPQTLTALERQDLPKEFFEVLVIDDGSSDATPGYLRRFSQSTLLRFHYHCQRQQGAAGARNWGIRNSRGKWVLFLDADVWVRSNVVRRHLERQKSCSQNSCCWLGRIDPSSVLDQGQQYRWNEFDIKTHGADVTELAWFQYRTPNSSFSRADLLRSRMFDMDFSVAEDIEFACRLSLNGMRYFYDVGIQAVHHHPLTLSQYLEKGRQYGRAAVIWQQKHPSHRADVALRTGVYLTEMPVHRKIRHLFKVLMVNRWTVPALKTIGTFLHERKIKWTPRVLTLVYRYQVRKSFRDYTRFCWK